MIFLAKVVKRALSRSDAITLCNNIYIYERFNNQKTINNTYTFVVAATDTQRVNACIIIIIL